MSILKVDTINEKTTGNGVHIAGHVIQRQVVMWTTVTDNSTETYADINSVTIDFTPKLSTSTLHVTVHYHSVVTPLPHQHYFAIAS